MRDVQSFEDLAQRYFIGVVTYRTDALEVLAEDSTVTFIKPKSLTHTEKECGMEPFSTEEFGRDALSDEMSQQACLHRFAITEPEILQFDCDGGIAMMHAQHSAFEEGCMRHFGHLVTMAFERNKASERRIAVVSHLTFPINRLQE